MSHPVARDEKSFQVINHCSLAGRILFEPKKGKRFPLRFAQIWYEYKGKKIAETATDNEGKFIFQRIPSLEGAIIYSMKTIINDEKYDIRQMGGDEYIGRFPKEKNKGIDCTSQNHNQIEIIIDDDQWIPDLMLREFIFFILSRIKGFPEMVAYENLWEIFREEIYQEIESVVKDFNFIKK